MPTFTVAPRTIRRQYLFDPAPWEATVWDVLAPDGAPVTSRNHKLDAVRDALHMTEMAAIMATVDTKG